jgi:hypothetical protein
MKMVKTGLLLMLPLVIVIGLGVFFLQQSTDKPVELENIGIIHTVFFTADQC